MLRRPHLVLPDAGDNRGASLRNVRQTLHDVLPQQPVGFGNSQGRMLRLEVLDVTDPIFVCGPGNTRNELPEHLLDVPKHRRFHADHLVEFSPVDVDVDLPGPG